MLHYVIATLLVVAVSSGIARNLRHAANETTDTENQSATSNQSTRAATSSTTLRTSELEPRIQTVLDRYPEIQVNLVLADLTSNTELLALGSPDVAMPAASITKLVTALATYTRITSGELDPEQVLGDFPVWYQVEQLVQQSNNDAWQLLNNQVFGYPNLEDFGRTTLGLTSYSARDNLLSPRDGLRLISLLASKPIGITDVQHTELMDYLRDTNEDSFIIEPLRKVAPTVMAWHKNGTLEAVVHEVALLSLPNGNRYSLSIFTDGNGMPSYDMRHRLFEDLLTAMF
jgi:beta-lactamase class A